MISRGEPREHQPARPLSNRAIALGAVIVLGIGAVAWTVLLWRYGSADPGVELDAIRTAGTVMVGVGGLAALWLAARRQRSTELTLEHERENAAEQRLTELYTRAVDQLGAEKAPVRLGGLHALERLAQSNPTQRQTIVDVICAYLRMPYTPPDDQAPGEDAPEDAHRRYEQRRQELQVRLTAQRILAAHLKPETEAAFWADIDLNLTEAYLHQFDLTACHVQGAQFRGATFAGDAAFDWVRFAGTVGFRDAKFAGDAHFTEAEFAGTAGFRDAKFAGNAWFGDAKFAGTAELGDAKFAGAASFGGVKFAGAASFGGVKFAEGAVFRGAEFAGKAMFSKATFARHAEFDEAIFGGDVGFSGAEFIRHAMFEKAKFTRLAGFRDVKFGTVEFGGDADFCKAEFGGNAWFDDATFGGDARFDDVTFTGIKKIDRACVAPNPRHIVLPMGWTTRAAQPAEGEEEGWLYVVRDEESSERPTEASDDDSDQL
ncbi:MAG: pentapeptide repeat-containing protein [Pseudonocardiaceae bacterium]